MRRPRSAGHQTSRRPDSHDPKGYKLRGKVVRGCLWFEERNLTEYKSRTIWFFELKFEGFVDIDVRFPKRYHNFNLKSSSGCDTHINNGYFLTGNLCGLCATSITFIQTCDVLFALYGTLLGLYKHVHNFIWSWDPSFSKPTLVAVRSPIFSRVKASLLDIFCASIESALSN